MGTWDTSIGGNDTFQDTYAAFFDMYNEGFKPSDISNRLLNDAGEYVDYDNEYNNIVFALALAQWETKSLDPHIYAKVKDLVETGKDLNFWKNEGVNTETLKERENALNIFLLQLSTVAAKAKRRKKKKFEFDSVSLVNIVAPDGNKTFEIAEEYVNQKYIHTGGLMMWGDGSGGSILYFDGQGKQITAQWLDSQTLEITHEAGMEFRPHEFVSCNYGDCVRIIYRIM